MSPAAQALYLGATKLQSFADKRLYNYWTSTPLAEANWVDKGFGDTELTVHNETLWVMGNKWVVTRNKCG